MEMPGREGKVQKAEVDEDMRPKKNKKEDERDPELPAQVRNRMITQMQLQRQSIPVQFQKY